MLFKDNMSSFYSKSMLNKQITDPPQQATTTTPQLTHLVGDTARFECQVSGHGNPEVYTFLWTRANAASFKTR